MRPAMPKAPAADVRKPALVWLDAAALPEAVPVDFAAADPDTAAAPDDLAGVAAPLEAGEAALAPVAEAPPDDPPSVTAVLRQDESEPDWMVAKDV